MTAAKSRKKKKRFTKFDRHQLKLRRMGFIWSVFRNRVVADKQAMASLLSPAHYKSFFKSSQFMCIYNRRENSCVELNQCMRDRMQGTPTDDISVIVESEAETYITVSGIPCKLRVVLDLDGDLSMMEMFPAHSKKWMQSSDLIQLTDLSSDGVWEWFPSVNFEFMSKRFWSILGYDQHDMDETPLAWMDFLNPDDKDAEDVRGSYQKQRKVPVPRSREVHT